MSARRLWMGCAIAGALAFLASFLFGRIPGLTPCGPAPQGLGAILGFETVRSPAAVATLFGAEPCRSTLVAAQRTGLFLDGLWFIPAYTSFLMLGALAAHRRAGRSLAAMALLAGLSDQVEGVLLWLILDRLPGTSDLIDAVFWAMTVKFGLLFFVTIFIGLSLCTTDRRRPVWLLGGAILFSGVRAATVFGRSDIAGAMHWLGIAWSILLLTAVIGAVRPAFLASRGADKPNAISLPA